MTIKLKVTPINEVVFIVCRSDAYKHIKVRDIDIHLHLAPAVHCSSSIGLRNHLGSGRHHINDQKETDSEAAR